MKNNETSGACGANGEEEWCIQGFGGETRMKGLFLRWKDVIKMASYEIAWECVD
jgi:hypothetical protein